MKCDNVPVVCGICGMDETRAVKHECLSVHG